MGIINRWGVHIGVLTFIGEIFNRTSIYSKGVQTFLSVSFEQAVW